MAKRQLCLLLLAMLIACTSKAPSEIAQLPGDTARNYSPVAAVVPNDRPPAVMDTTLKDVDTLFNSLVKMDAVHGNFVSVTRITENFIDASNLTSEKILPAFLILSGDGEYGGMHEGVAYQNLYSVLAVFEEIEGELKYVTHLELAASSSGGLVLSTTEGDEIQLAEERFGVLIHNKSSEEGAGDSGFRRDDAELYVLINGKIEKVFQETLDDFSFASNESDSYGEQTTTVELTVLDSKTLGLFDLKTIRTTSGNSWTEEEEQEEEESAENEQDAESTEASDEQPAEVDDGIDTYQWTGSTYEISDNEN